MRRFIARRMLPVFVVIAMVCPLFVFSVSASGYTDTDSVSDWTEHFDINGRNALVDAILAYANKVGITVSISDHVDACWFLFDKAIPATGSVSMERLENICTQLNNLMHSKAYDGFFSQIFVESQNLANMYIAELLGITVCKFEVEQHPSSGFYRIRETHSGNWLVNSYGSYPYAEVLSDGTTAAGNKWVGERSCSTAQVNKQNYETISAINANLIDRGVDSKLQRFGNYWAIWSDHQYYCDSLGRPIVAPYDKDKWATNQDRPATEVKDENGEDATDEDGNVLQETVEGDNININMEGMTVTLPDGSINMIDRLIYDESTKTYYIDSHDTINNTVNNYYSWTYHINYTSITYIGQTEEYNKYYEVYYELPDGRSSADLTAEELEQLNLTIDVIPYGRSADDTSLRSLYHFDGDTKDSSYWNYCTDFEWVEGASLTYMDAGVFDGALYLDENKHWFTITLPSNLGTSDFTFQFRWYQSHTEAPVRDSQIILGGHCLFKWDGASIYNGGAIFMSTLPTGTWNEIAIIRKGNDFCYYLNGVPIRDTEFYQSLNNQIKFELGNEQQTYKYLDELRVLNRAIVTPGEPYTPTSVPHDTNLTLVLPDSVAPVADEYWEITHNTGTHLAEDYTDNAELASGVVTGLDKMTTADGVAITPVEVANQATHITRYNNIVAGANSISTAFKLIEYELPTWGNGYYGVIATVSTNGKSYEVSGVVHGGVDDYGVWHPGDNSGYCCSDMTRIDNGIMGFAYDNLCIAVDPASAGFTLQAVDIVVSEKYSKLADAQAYVDTFANQFTTEKVSSIVGIEKAEMNTPTLAVRTDIPITNYQIGGVRPSVPYKGLVWALVEKGYITSIQIYNGQAWESVDGRIWTGERWIPFSSYNVITLQDMYDIVDATPNFEYIYTESGFWSWWQKSWNSFTERFFASGGSSGTIAPSTVKETVSNALSALITGLFTMITEVLKSLIGAGADLISGFFGFLSETVLGGVKDFFFLFTDGSLFGFFQQENENGSSTTGLPSGVSGAFAFISGVIMLLPDELRNLLIFGVGALLFFAVLKIVKA